MFGIGGFELFLILLFGFLIFGPDKLPQIARTVGVAIARFRDAQEEMTQVVKTELYDPSQEGSFKNPLDAIDKANIHKYEKQESYAERKEKHDRQRAERIKREAAVEAAREVRAQSEGRSRDEVHDAVLKAREQASNDAHEQLEHEARQNEALVADVFDDGFGIAQSEQEHSKADALKAELHTHGSIPSDAHTLSTTMHTKNTEGEL